jgi:predicted esterase
MVTVTARSRIQDAKKSKKKLKVQRRRADLLPAVIYRPVQPSRVHRWTLIYLHGFGSSAFGQYGSAPHYFLDGSIAIKVVVPTAPSRELSIFDQWWLKVQARRPAKGASSNSSRPTARRCRWRLNQFNAWYDYLTNNDGKREDTLDLDSLQVIQRVLHKLVRKEAAELNGRTDRVILGGKSQGCCTALDAALTFPQRLGGFIGVVGHLLKSSPVDADGPQAEAPFHFFHEITDDIMKWAWVQQGIKRLKCAGYRVHSRRAKDPEGNGHYVGGGFEGRSIRQALSSICSK